MTKRIHIIYILSLIMLTIIAVIFLILRGYSYYLTNLTERFFHYDYTILRPSGQLGHGYGIIGSLMMVIGVVIYLARKRIKAMSRLGFLKHWLEFHIFLCTLGPILILFHTSFKFGGLVAISFWSMTAVFISGIIGRFIYIQIPRSIEGKELNLNEINNYKTELSNSLLSNPDIDEEIISKINTLTRKKVEVIERNFIHQYFKNRKSDKTTFYELKKMIFTSKININERKKILKVIKEEIKLNRRVGRLDTMKNLFKYWHVAHIPFAIVMIIIMFIHIGITIYFGYTWIF